MSLFYIKSYTLTHAHKSKWIHADLNTHDTSTHSRVNAPMYTCIGPYLCRYNRANGISATNQQSARMPISRRCVCRPISNGCTCQVTWYGMQRRCVPGDVVRHATECNGTQRHATARNGGACEVTWYDTHATAVRARSRSTARIGTQRRCVPGHVVRHATARNRGACQVTWYGTQRYATTVRSRSRGTKRNGAQKRVEL